MLASWILGLVTLLPTAVLADGMVFPQTAYARPEIPDQRALIHFANGTETLVIETAFTGPGTNFAWVVPLPTLAKIEPVSTGLFPTLQVIFQPQVVLSVKHYWLALPITALLIWVVAVVRRSVWSAFVLALVLLCAVVFLLPLFMPAVSRATASATTTAANVRVLNRQNVGVFETATIQSTDPSALLHWLNENGFSAPTNVAPAVADYVREGWVFVAARLHRETGEETTQATHPLAFTFQTAKPVYPLRLTGTGISSCRVDLYVFGPGRAKAHGFKVKRCEAPNYDASAAGPRLKPESLRIRHQELSKLVPSAAVATKLSAVLDASAMAHDAYVTWEPYRPSGGKLYSTGAALTLSVNVSTLLFMVLALVWWVVSWIDGSHGFQTKKWGKWLAPVSVVVGLVMYFFVVPRTDSTSFRVTRARWITVRNDSIALAIALGDELGDSNVVRSALAPVRPLTPTELEHVLQALARDSRGVWPERPTSPLTNFFTGEAIRFEASPGNVLLRPATPGHRIIDNVVLDRPANGYELIWHDLDGAEAITNSVLPYTWQQ